MSLRAIAQARAATEDLRVLASRSTIGPLAGTAEPLEGMSYEELKKLVGSAVKGDPGGSEPLPSQPPAPAPAADEPAPPPPAAPPAAPAGTTVPTADDAKATLAGQLIGYVPTDALTVFVALTAFTATGPAWLRLLVLVGVAVVSPIWVVIQYRDTAQTAEALKVWPAFQMAVGTAAFLAWSTSLPGAYWQADLNLKPAAGGGIAVAASALIGLAVHYYAQQHRVFTSQPTPPVPATG